MKKFKSLMLAALATAAMAAPSFADNHGGANLGINKISGEVVVEMKYTATSPDEGDGKTNYDGEIGDVNINFGSDLYSVYFEKDDEKDLVSRLKIHPSMTSGDNKVEALAELNGLNGADGKDAYGDVYVKGSNKTFSLKIGQFGSSEYYGNGMGVSRAALTIDNDNIFEGGENLVINGFHGFQADINAGDVQLEVALPWMNTDGTGSPSYALEDKTTGAALATNVTGIRPAVKFNSGGVDFKALFYTLNFEAQVDGADPADKTRSAFQLVGSFKAGAATIGGFYQSQTQKDGSAELTPSAAGGNVVVALGGGQKVGASFDVLDNGAEDAANVKATRFSASYQMPFFVESVALKLGVGTSSQTSDTKTLAGSATSAQAAWAYSF